MGQRVFINYRREDTAGHAGRLDDALASRLPSAEVFMDVGDIQPGIDFRTAIADAVATCDVMLALVGPYWTVATTRAGTRRLDDPDDYVVAEIAAALERDVRVIPVLIDGAPMPHTAELPERIRGFEHRNALTLDTVSWPADLDSLLAVLRDLLGPPANNASESTEPAAAGAMPRSALWTGALVAIAGVVVTAIILARDGSQGDGRFEPLRVTPGSAPSGTTIDVSGSACPRLPDGEVPDVIHYRLRNPRSGEDVARSSAPMRPGESWRGTIEIPAGTPPAEYTVLAGCFATDPRQPVRGSASFHDYPGARFDVTPS